MECLNGLKPVPLYSLSTSGQLGWLMLTGLQKTHATGSGGQISPLFNAPNLLFQSCLLPAPHLASLIVLQSPATPRPAPHFVAEEITTKKKSTRHLEAVSKANHGQEQGKERVQFLAQHTDHGRNMCSE